MQLFKSKFLFLSTLFFYGLLLTVVMLYFRFPAERVRLFCETELEQLLKGSDCSISGIRYSFPFAVMAKTIRFNDLKQKEEELFTITNVRISPQLAAPTSRFGVQVDAFGGSHGCTLEIDRGEKEFRLQDIRVKDINPATIPFLQRASGREITGTVSGEGMFHGKWEKGRYVTDGKGTLSLEKGTFALLLPILSLERIDLREFKTELLFQDHVLQCRNGIFHGDELRGEFSGTMGLQSGLKRARLSFIGELEPLPPLLQKNKHAQDMVIQLLKQQKHGTVPFILQGTVQKPSFRFES